MQTTITHPISSPPARITLSQATTIKGYVADAAICCSTCHAARYGNAETDHEGNQITPVMALHCDADVICDACQHPLIG